MLSVAVVETSYVTTQQVDETFAVTVEIVVDFMCRFSEKARKSISYLYTCTYLTPQVTTTITSDFPFNSV